MFSHHLGERELVRRWEPEPLGMGWAKHGRGICWDKGKIKLNHGSQ